MANEVKAQVAFTMTLFDDGRVTCHESFAYREKSGEDLTHSSEWHPIEGTCDPQELAYTLWAEMEGHI